MSIRNSKGAIYDSCPYINRVLKITEDTLAEHLYAEIEDELEKVRDINSALRNENLRLEEEKEELEKNIEVLQEQIVDLKQMLQENNLKEGI